MLFLLQTENMGKVCIFNVCVLPKGTRENTGHGWTPVGKKKKKYTIIWYNAKYLAFKSTSSKKRYKRMASEDTV